MGSTIRYLSDFNLLLRRAVRAHVPSPSSLRTSSSNFFCTRRRALNTAATSLPSRAAASAAVSLHRGQLEGCPTARLDTQADAGGRLLQHFTVELLLQARHQVLAGRQRLQALLHRAVAGPSEASAIVQSQLHDMR
jgi:hypothetical protein